MKIDVLDILFDNLTPQQALDRGALLLDGPDFHYVVTPNPEFVLRR